MANRLYKSIGEQNNPFSNIMAQINQFKQTFKGDPRAEVERLLHSGQMTQAQFNSLSQTANQIMQAMGGNT